MPQPIDSTIAIALSQELLSSAKIVRHCVGQLNDEQLWWRPKPEMNSVANLMLHLSGNIRQWIIAGLGGMDDIRERQKEFDEVGPIPKAELLQSFDATVDAAARVLAEVTADNLTRERIIQAFPVTGAKAAVHAVAHFQGHVQEIVHMTRIQLGEAYQFDFVPTPAQGGTAD